LSKSSFSFCHSPSGKWLNGNGSPAADVGNMRERL
jgi:hypothetical protein